MAQEQHRFWGVIRQMGRHEIALLVASFLAISCIYLFAELADEVTEGETQEVDEWVLTALRRPEDPGTPVGPTWLHEVGLDLTALGSIVVLVLFSLAVIGFLLLSRQYGMAWLIIVALAGGMAISSLLKYLIDRGRPAVVPHLREVVMPSFPSGHAMLSAVVYLTLGALLIRIVHGRTRKIYCLAVALLLSILVGLSRVYLGVHYPTDVLAGWMAGLAWALICWAVAESLGRKHRI